MREMLLIFAAAVLFQYVSNAQKDISFTDLCDSLVTGNIEYSVVSKGIGPDETILAHKYVVIFDNFILQKRELSCSELEEINNLYNDAELDWYINLILYAMFEEEASWLLICTDPIFWRRVYKSNHRKNFLGITNSK